MSRVMAFVDGENLTVRFESMLNEGTRKVRARTDDQFIQADVSHEPGRFVWSNGTVFGVARASHELIRVHYYTTFSGASDELEKFTERIGGLQALIYQDESQWMVSGSMPLIPKVFKKESRNTRTKSVDINLCVDVLEYVRQDALDTVYLVTGDVDYLPLIESVMRSGKRVYLAALSSGLSSRLRYGLDKFIPLDKTYFSQTS